MLHPHPSPLGRILESRRQARLDLVRPQAEAALTALQELGVRAKLVGSLAKGSFRLHSDVDILVLDTGPASEPDIWAAVEAHLKDAPFDLHFAHRMSKIAVELMLADASSTAGPD